MPPDGKVPAQGKVAYANDHYRVEMLPDGIVVITRTSRPMAREEIERVCTPVQNALDKLGRNGRRLLVDTRRAPGNNDPAFEAAFAPQRQRMVLGFERVALLVQTMIGRLQNARLAQSAKGATPQVFLTMETALASLRG